MTLFIPTTRVGGLTILLIDYKLIRQGRLVETGRLRALRELAALKQQELHRARQTIQALKQAEHEQQARANGYTRQKLQDLISTLHCQESKALNLGPPTDPGGDVSPFLCF